MSLAITGDVLAIAGTFLLTLGAGAQALANLAEYKTMKTTVSEAARAALDDAVFNWTLFSRMGVTPLVHQPGAGYGILRGFLFIFLPRKLAEIRAQDAGEAAELARFLRLAVIWAIIMIGSALALAAACIQLALA